ncbi:hypothetical protein [Methanobrevibacter sp. UBA212]|uniref:hypothetical protein n=1 Tax=Methanobrevibacter sp. UBA212 TaxID=1915476 RepID=UPI0025EA5870|nr:hypothetical protein [Methanobrevibacter sp. UBA212]
MYANFYSYEDNLNSKNCTSSVLSYNSISDPLPNNHEDIELYVKDMPYEEKREKIIDYAELNRVVDALEIADALQLDVFEVNEIMVQLIKEGILEEL